MSIFNLSTGKKAETTGSFEIGVKPPPIPEGTKVKAAISEAKWSEYQGTRYISLRWDVLDGEYKKRAIFHKVKVYEEDPKTADRHRNMLAAIDANCGGKLQQIEGEPTDIDLLKCLANKPMIIRLGVWELDDKSNSGNWVTAVESNGKAAATAAKKPESAPVKKDVEADTEGDEDQIPF